MMPISKQQPKNSGSFHSNNNRNSNHNLKNESNFTVTFQQQNTQGGSKKNLDNVNSTH
jgi:hypothetical protein